MVIVPRGAGTLALGVVEVIGPPAAPLSVYPLGTVPGGAVQLNGTFAARSPLAWQVNPVGGVGITAVVVTTAAFVAVQEASVCCGAELRTNAGTATAAAIPIMHTARRADLESIILGLPTPSNDRGDRKTEADRDESQESSRENGAGVRAGGREPTGAR